MEYELDPLTGDPLSKKKVVSANANSVPIDADTLIALDAMSKDDLISLIKRVSGAMWGVGIMAQEEREEAMLFKLATMALTSAEARDVVSTCKEYFDRVQGKPMQRVATVTVSHSTNLSELAERAARLFIDQKK